MRDQSADWSWQSVPPPGHFAPRRECLSFAAKRKTPKKPTQTYGLRPPCAGRAFRHCYFSPSRPRQLPGFSRSKGLCHHSFPLPLPGATVEASGSAGRAVPQGHLLRAVEDVGPYGALPEVPTKRKRIATSGFALLAMTSLFSEAPGFSAKTRRRRAAILCVWQATATKYWRKRHLSPLKPPDFSPRRGAATTAYRVYVEEP